MVIPKFAYLIYILFSIFNFHHSWLYIYVYKHSLKILKQRTKLQAVEIWEREREKKKVDDRKVRV